MNHFFGKDNFHSKSIEHYQHFDFNGVLGRYLSCSYADQNDHPNYQVMFDFLKSLFENHQEGGKVKM